MNKESPLYILDNSADSKSYAIGLKEGAIELQHVLGSLGGLNETELLNKKVAYSSNESIASAKYIGDIDIDPQGNATSGLGVTVKGGSTVYDVLTDGAPARDAVRATKFKNLSVLPSTIDLSGAEIELVGEDAREHRLEKALNELRGDFDYMFIDSPPSLGLLTLNALTAADSVLVPIQCEYYALEGVGQLMNTLNLVRKRLNPRLDVEGVVLTMLDGRTNLGLQVVGEVKKYFKGKVFKTVVPRNVRLSEAPSHGLPIHLYDARCPGADAYRRLAVELIERNEG